MSWRYPGTSRPVPHIAADLNNLAGLLQGTNRPDEAEPPYRRALTVFLKFRHLSRSSSSCAG